MSEKMRYRKYLVCDLYDINCARCGKHISQCLIGQGVMTLEQVRLCQQKIGECFLYGDPNQSIKDALMASQFIEDAKERNPEGLGLTQLYEQWNAYYMFDQYRTTYQKQKNLGSRAPEDVEYRDVKQ